MLCREHTAGGGDVFPSRSSDRCRHPCGVEVVRKALHSLLLGGGQSHVGDTMITDQIDMTVERTDKPQECFGMGDIVVKPPENDVLKGKSTLPREVIPLEKSLWFSLWAWLSLWASSRVAPRGGHYAN